MIPAALLGWHWQASIRTAPRYVNIPFWPHHVIVIGMGNLSRNGVFRKWLPCAYIMRLQHCCPGRVSS